MSTQRALFRLVHDMARTHAIAAVRLAPQGHVVEIKPATRSSEQNRLFHALLQDIEDSGYEWVKGRILDVDDLKTMFVTGWMNHEGHLTDVIIGVDDKPVQLRRSTTTFSKEELSGLIEFTRFECAKRRIVFKDDGK